jgi:hypothetical protein
MTQADAAAYVLEGAGRPMHRKEIAEEIVRRQMPVWRRGSPGNTPQESVGRALTQEILRDGRVSRFAFEGGKGSGVFRLREQPANRREKPDRSLEDLPALAPVYRANESASLLALAFGDHGDRIPPQRSTIEVTLDAGLLRRVQRQAEARHVLATELIREAIEAAVQRGELEELEHQWVESYRVQRETADERDESRAWQTIQRHGEPWDHPAE